MSGSEGPRSAPSYKMSYTKAGWIRLHLGSWADNLRVFPIEYQDQILH